mmetsp:Transcript_12076/g.25725  ORF Transcript_12076/g.25725 Transcript_12076/m.25725 type:complete len:104 (-) Transcript_12076:37-348(-)
MPSAIPVAGFTIEKCSFIGTLTSSASVGKGSAPSSLIVWSSIVDSFTFTGSNSLYPITYMTTGVMMVMIVEMICIFAFASQNRAVDLMKRISYYILSTQFGDD